MKSLDILASIVAASDQIHTGVTMRRRVPAAILCLLVVLMPAVCLGGGCEAADSSYWTALVHQENSVVASVLYLPYIILKGPIRIIDGIINPKPTSQATIPPAAHRK
jgi:hypothetical protein